MYLRYSDTDGVYSNLKVALEKNHQITKQVNPSYFSSNQVTWKAGFSLNPDNIGDIYFNFGKIYVF